MCVVVCGGVCALFVVRCLLAAVCCLLFVGCCLVCAVCCVLCVVFGVSYSLLTGGLVFVALS